MIWTAYVELMGERRCAYRILVGKPEAGKHLEDPGTDGGIVLK